MYFVATKSTTKSLTNIDEMYSLSFTKKSNAVAC